MSEEIRSAEPKVRDVVQRYMAAALAGKTADAAALAASGASPEFEKTVDTLRQMLDVKSEDIQEAVPIETVRVAGQKGRALAVTAPVKLSGPQPDGQATGHFVFTLERAEGDWLIEDIDFESKEGAAKEILAFEKQYPEAQQAARPGISVELHIAPGTPQKKAAEIGRRLSAAGFVASWVVTFDSGRTSGIGAVVKATAPTPYKDIKRVVDLLHGAGVEQVTVGVLEALGKKGPAQEPAPSESRRELKVFRLVHADAQAMSSVVSRLFRNVLVAADQRSNSVVVSGSRDELDVIEALLLRLDASQPDRPSEALESSRGDVMPRRTPPSAVPQPAALRENYEQLEQQAAQLAQQLRDLSLKATRTPGDAEALKRQLAGVVSRAFEARQKLQRAELDGLRQRLARIEEQIAALERIRDIIIQRRIEELIDPNLRWEPDGAHAAAGRPSVPPATSYPRSELPRPAAQTGTAVPGPAAQVQIELTLFEATEQASKELGLVPARAIRGQVNYWPSPQDFGEKLWEQAERGEATILAEPILVTTLGRPASVEVPNHTFQLQIKLTTASESDVLAGELYGLAVSGSEMEPAARAGMPSPPLPRIPIRQLTYDVPTVIGPFSCPTEGRQAFLRLRASRVKPAPPLPALRTAPATSPAAPASDLRPAQAVQPSPLILRTAAEFASQLAVAEEELRQLTQLQEKGQADAATVEQARQKRALVHDEYAAQMRLLEIELHQAESAVAHAVQRQKLIEAQYKAGRATVAEATAAQHDVEAAYWGVGRAETLLELYRKAGEAYQPQDGPADAHPRGEAQEASADQP